MLKVALVGASGKFGQSVLELYKALKPQNFQFSTLVSKSTHQKIDPFVHLPYVALKNIEMCNLVIEIASSEATNLCLDICKNKKIPLIIGSTGHNHELQEKILKYSKYIPIFKAQNFSFVLQLYLDMVKKISNNIKMDCYLDLIEKHRAEKKDTPSGTALEIAKALEMKYEIASFEEARKKDTLHIHPIRSHDHGIQHDLRIAFPYEELSIKHTVFNRKAYAQGVLMAIEFLQNASAGYYEMSSLINSITKESQ